MTFGKKGLGIVFTRPNPFLIKNFYNLYDKIKDE